MRAITVFVAREEKGASFKVGAMEIPLLHQEWEHTLSGESLNLETAKHILNRVNSLLLSANRVLLSSTLSSNPGAPKGLNQQKQE